MDSQQNDPLLFPFLEATEEAEGEPLLRLFADHIGPTVKNILARRLRPRGRFTARGETSHDGAEIRNAVYLNLLKRLRELKADPSASPIANLRSYVVTATIHTHDEYLRGRYPLRRNLYDRLRYHLSNDPGLALWADAGLGWITGLATWGADRRGRAAELSPQNLRELIERTRESLQPTPPQRVTLPDLMRAVLRVAGSPLTLNQMIFLVGDLQQIHDLPAESFNEGDNRGPDAPASRQPDPETMAERHQLIELLWEEICRLPRRHRIALLFNLRSEGAVNVLTLLPLTGVATFEQIAETLEIPIQQFESIWPNLPMDDLSIADYLGATRQQVINLRKNARGRLHRLLAALEEGRRRP